MIKLLRYILYIVFFVFFSSCDEEKITNVKEKENEIISNIIPPFEILELFPEYTFWNHTFKITLDFNNYYDSLPISFYFNKRKLVINEKIVNENKVNFILRTPGNAISDSLEIRYYEDDDSVSVYSRLFEVVNSEVKLDSLVYKNNYYIYLYLKNYKYSNHITIYYKNKIEEGFIEKFSYLNSLVDFLGTKGVVEDNRLTFFNNNLQSFGLRIEAIEELSQSKQIHAYNYFYKSTPNEKFKYLDEKFELQLVKTYIDINNYINLEFRNLQNKENVEEILFDGVDVTSEIIFKPYRKKIENGKIIENLGSLIFKRPNSYHNNVVKILYSNGKDTTIFIQNFDILYYKNVITEYKGINLNYGDTEFNNEKYEKYKKLLKYEKLKLVRNPITILGDTIQNYNSALTFDNYSIYNGLQVRFFKNDSMTIRYSETAYYNTNEVNGNIFSLFIFESPQFNIIENDNLFIIKIELNKPNSLTSSYVQKVLNANIYNKYFNQIFNTSDISNDAYIKLTFER